MGTKDRLDEEEVERLYTDPERTASTVPKVAAILDGKENEHAAMIRSHVEESMPDHDPDDVVRTSAASSLYQFAQRQPDVVAMYAPLLVEILRDPDDPARQRIAQTVIHASEEPGPFVECLSDLTPLFCSDSLDIRAAAVGIVTNIAKEMPGEAAPVVDDLVSLLDDDSPQIQKTVMDSLGKIAGTSPEAVVPVADAFIPLVDEPSDVPRYQQGAIGLVGRIATVAPEVIDPDRASDRLRRALQSDRPEIRAQTLDAVCILIVESPERFADLEPSLEPGLDAENRLVRRTTAQVYVAIAASSSTVVSHPNIIAERLRTLDEEFDLSAQFENLDNALAHALGALDAVTENET